jgi:hypothetical protein
MYRKFWSQELEGRSHSEDLIVDEMIILEWISGECGGRVWTGFVCLSIGTSGGPYEYENELPGSVKGEEFLD